tara:strand:+ start:464 stop:1000 length:537 start_codon:yes stop_codon:yes gene_type:complete
MLICSGFTGSVKAAEEIAFVSGVFRRSISIEDIERLIKGEDVKSFLGDLAKVSNEDPENISQILTQQIELPIVITSKLMYTKIGETILKRIAKIIYPLKLQKDSISIPAIRSAVIKGLVDGNGKIDMILFLKSYPNKIIAVNVPALFKVIKKVESISELIEFFSDSPLENLKNGTMKT